MQYALIKCSVCEEHVGSVKKEQITQDDRDSYAQTTQCSSGHAGSVVLMVANEEELSGSGSVWQRLISFFLGR
jgi:hypothetical protein